MNAYRIYIVAPDGRVQLGEAFEAEGDDQAVARAVEASRQGRAVEIWQGGRMLGRVARDGRFTPGH